ncbi:hypothetical protein F01_460157 [Burkholderia cenocepacia]|nr:hypothetical protein F01_460157 [Burkholderia cenocepacia]
MRDTMRRLADARRASGRNPNLSGEACNGIREIRVDRAGRVEAGAGLHDVRRAVARHAPVDAAGSGKPADHPAGDRGRHQLLRHREHVFGRHVGGDRRPRAARFREARRRRDRDQGVLPDAAGAERRRAVAQGDHDRHRPEPEAARHRLRRSLPDSPMGLRHADRGDARGVARRREGRQGALYRRLVDVRMAVREGAAHVEAARLDPLRQHAEPPEPAVSRGRARNAAAVRGRRHRGDSVEPARARAPDAQLGRIVGTAAEGRGRAAAVQRDDRCRQGGRRGRRGDRRRAQRAAGAGRAGVGRAKARRDRADRRHFEAAAAGRCARGARAEADRRRNRDARTPVRAARGGRVQLSGSGGAAAHRVQRAAASIG